MCCEFDILQLYLSGDTKNYDNVLETPLIILFIMNKFVYQRGDDVNIIPQIWGNGPNKGERLIVRAMGSLGRPTSPKHPSPSRLITRLGRRHVMLELTNKAQNMCVLGQCGP